MKTIIQNKTKMSITGRKNLLQFNPMFVFEKYRAYAQLNALC